MPLANLGRPRREDWGAPEEDGPGAGLRWSRRPQGGKELEASPGLRARHGNGHDVVYGAGGYARRGLSLRSGVREGLWEAGRRGQDVGEAEEERGR